MWLRHWTLLESILASLVQTVCFTSQLSDPPTHARSQASSVFLMPSNPHPYIIWNVTYSCLPSWSQDLQLLLCLETLTFKNPLKIHTGMIILASTFTSVQNNSADTQNNPVLQESGGGGGGRGRPWWAVSDKEEDGVSSFQSRRAWRKEQRWSFLRKQGRSLLWVTCLGFPQFINTQWSLQGLKYRGCVGMQTRRLDNLIFLLLLSFAHLLWDPTFGVFILRAHFLIGVGVSGSGGDRMIYIYDSILRWIWTEEEEQKVRLRQVTRKRFLLKASTALGLRNTGLNKMGSRF